MMPMPLLVGLLLAGVLLAAPLAVRADSRPAPGRSQGSALWANLTTARGVVKSVSATRLVLETGEPEPKAEMALVLGEKTIVMKGRQVLTLKDLKRGDPVTVAYVQDNGRAVATRIWLRSGEKATGAPSGSTQGAKMR